MATSNISPISRISNDILPILFRYHVLNELQHRRDWGWKNLNTMLDLSHVCSRWRGVAMDNPLCRAMEIVLCNRTSVEKLNLYLQRSQQVPPLCSSRCSFVDIFSETTMDILSSNIPRCRSLVIRIRCGSFSPPRSLRDAHAPFLETMGLDAYVTGLNEPVFFQHGCPMLSSLQLRGGVADSLAQTSLVAFDPAHITSLELSFSIDLSASYTQYDHLRVTLMSMSLLKVLKLDCERWGDCTTVLKPLIELDHLQSLYLTFTDRNHGVTLNPLFCIKTPSLDLLDLSIRFSGDRLDDGGYPRSFAIYTLNTVSPHYRGVRQFSLRGNVTKYIFHPLAEMCPNLISLRLDLDEAHECLEALTSCLKYQRHYPPCGALHWPRLQEMVLGVKDIDLPRLAVILQERKAKGRPIQKVDIRWPQQHYNKCDVEQHCYLKVLSQISALTRGEILDIYSSLQG